MKKILVLMLALVMALSVCAFAACDKPVTLSGEYKYANPWDATKFYGVKVDVTVKGDAIQSVVVTSTDTAEYTNLSASWEDKAKWTDGQAAFLASFAGMTVAEVNAVEVACAESGQPNTVTGMEYVTGATQSSGRVILAVQNALKFYGTKTVSGEYKYANAWVEGAFYGVKVDVTVENNVVTAVTVTSTDTAEYTNLSASWEDKAKWTDGQADFLASFAGKTVAEVMSIVVDCAENGQPNTVTGFTAVAGATQSSGRVILAVQNALSK